MAQKVDQLFTRMQSMMNNRIGTARLKIAPRVRAVHRFGLEVVCSCPLR